MTSVQGYCGCGKNNNEERSRQEADDQAFLKPDSSCESCGPTDVLAKCSPSLRAPCKSFEAKIAQKKGAT